MLVQEMKYCDFGVAFSGAGNLGVISNSIDPFHRTGWAE